MITIVPQYDYPDSIGYQYVCITEHSPYAELHEIVLVHFRNNKQGGKVLFIQNKNAKHMWKAPQVFFDEDYISLAEWRNKQINRILEDEKH